jgi:lipopolysaccharide transport system permease protein
MPSSLTTLYQHRELLLMWTLKEIKVRYKQSLLGIAWAVLQPVSLMVIFTAVFSFLAQLPSDGIPYPAFAFVALLPWTFLATSITFGIPSLVNNLQLVTKIYFPREILPLGSIGAAFVDFLVSLPLFFLLLIWYEVPLSWTILWLPILVMVQLALILGVVLPAAALTVFYRDVRFIVPLGVQLWLYLTPVIYPISMVPEMLRPIYALNPLVGITDSYRRVLLLNQPPSLAYLGTSAVLSCMLLVVGYAYFKRAEGRFADLI